MTKIKALRSFRFDGKNHKDGDELDVPHTVARVLASQRKAEIAAPPAPSAPAVEEQTARPRTRGRYARRDMVAEEHKDVVHNAEPDFGTAPIPISSPEPIDESHDS